MSSDAPQHLDGNAAAGALTDVFAFDITTGNPVPFPHDLNAQGMVVRANPAGTRIYVGGDFTDVDGVPRSHIAAFDVATGSLVDFNARADGQVRGFAFAGDDLGDLEAFEALGLHYGS